MEKSSAGTLYKEKTMSAPTLPFLESNELNAQTRAQAQAILVDDVVPITDKERNSLKAWCVKTGFKAGLGCPAQTWELYLVCVIEKYEALLAMEEEG